MQIFAANCIHLVYVLGLALSRELVNKDITMTPTKFLFVLITILLLEWPALTFANLSLVTWKGTYYGAIPNKKGISKTYCKEHTLGTFVHVVKKPFTKPIYTDRGIKLDHS